MAVGNVGWSGENAARRGGSVANPFAAARPRIDHAFLGRLLLYAGDVLRDILAPARVFDDTRGKSRDPEEGVP
jgi:hypothetical protein